MGSVARHIVSRLGGRAAGAASRMGALAGAALVVGTGAAGCAPADLSLTVSGLPSPASDEDHATADHAFRAVSAEITCETGDNYRTCLVTLRGDDQAWEGETRSLLLTALAVGGEADLDALPVGYDALTYAHTDDLSGDHPSFAWACAGGEGALTLDADPAPGTSLTGSFDLSAPCADALGGSAEEVAFSGAFTVTPTGADPAAAP